MIRAVIFDLDGVLVDATEWHYLALNRALKLFGFTITLDEHRKSYNGIPTRKKLELLTREKGLPQSLHPIIFTMKQEYTRDTIYECCREEFAKVYMVQKLKQQGYKLMVCSNSIRDTVNIMTKQSGVFPFCDFLLCNEDVEHPKPHPEMYLKAFEKLGLSPEECVIVEDSEPGRQSAHSSGGHVLEVEGYEEVNYERVNLFIRSLTENEK